MFLAGEVNHLLWSWGTFGLADVLTVGCDVIGPGIVIGIEWISYG